MQSQSFRSNHRQYSPNQSLSRMLNQTKYLDEEFRETKKFF
jgi:hypothetical protein